MANTTSLAWPNMFDVARNRVSVLEDNTTITNRVKLLLLTSPGELYNNPEQGVGLSKFLWQYHTVNTVAQIRDNIVAQLAKYEPFVQSEKTSVSDNSDDTLSMQDALGRLKLTVGVVTTFEEPLEVTIDE